MRMSIILVVVLLALSSCYSYRNFQNIPTESGGIYKITDEHKRISKIQLIEIRQDSLVVLKNSKQFTIANSKFTNPKKRKFSAAKTAALYVGGSVVVGTVIIAAVLGNAFKHMGTIQSPP
ncbi:hypothetical protein QF004_001098 [Chryseobacterium sp. MDT2-18]|nr:hypothetical protein [Chryseobacterium sp. MDT2-18]